jgi:hypothetical protein
MSSAVGAYRELKNVYGSLQKVKRSDEHKFPATERLLVSARAPEAPRLSNHCPMKQTLLRTAQRKRPANAGLFASG